MKKYLLLPILAFAFFISTPSFAQLTAGAGLAYGTDFKDIGVQVRGIYQLTEIWGLGADVIVWLDGIDDLTIWELNLNGQYAFLNSGSTRVYALVGLNIVSLNIDGSSGSETGVNIGTGAQLPITDRIKGFAELRFVLGDLDQLVLSGGILIDL